MARDGYRSRSSPQISVEGVSKVFYPLEGAPIIALADLSMTIVPGEFVAVLGPSGCGKSTLLSIVAGLAKATRGTIKIDGETLTAPYTDAGVVFQRDLLLEWRTSLENILLQFEMRGMKASDHTDRAVELLDMVKMLDFAGRYPRELSGGMRQRIAICRALAHEPGLLLMDEPFGSLDALTREELNDELAAITGHTKKTVMFITHSISEAVFLADRVVVVCPRPGRITADVQIDLPRPRGAEIRSSTSFSEHIAEIRTILTHSNGG